MRSPTRRIVYILLLCAGLALGGLLAQKLFQSDVPKPTTSLTAVELGDTKPLHKLGNVYLGGQPAPEDFELLNGQGITSIINLRHPGETDWDEAELAEEFGMQYIRLPIQSREDLTDELFDQALETLSENVDGKTLVHCTACSRVGAIWYAYRVLEQDAKPEDAEQEARTAGMRGDWLLEAAKEYVARRKIGADGVQQDENVHLNE